METVAYTDPVAKLLTLGMNNDLTVCWPDYLQMGFTNEHIPELIRLTQDFELEEPFIDYESDNPADAYGQVHAWRTLAQLQAIEAIPAFLTLLRKIDSFRNNFISGEIPHSLSMLGEAAINPCYELLSDRSQNTYARILAISTLARIGIKHPGMRPVCVTMLINSLAEYIHTNKDVNSYVILALADLKSQEAGLLVEKVIREGYSEKAICGDYNCYKFSIGVLHL